MNKIQKKNVNNSNKILWIILILSLLFAVSFPLIISKKYNDQSSNWYNFLGGFVGGAIGGIATLIAIVISTNQTRKIQEDAMNLEDKREKDKIKENALIVYYDLLYGLNDLKKLYIGIVKGEVRSNIPNRMYFCNNWIERVALFSHSNELKDKIDEIYLLYGDLMIIRDLLCKNIIFDTNTPKYTELKEKIIEISKKAFNIEGTALSDINTNNTYDANQWEDVKKEIISIESTFGGKKETRRILNNKYEKILMKLKEVGL